MTTDSLSPPLFPPQTIARVSPRPATRRCPDGDKERKIHKKKKKKCSEKSVPSYIHFLGHHKWDFSGNFLCARFV